MTDPLESELSSRRRAVILDMDGLMLDTEPIYRYAWQSTAADLGFPIDDQLYEQFIGRRTGDCERILMNALGSVFPLEDFRSSWPERWRKRVSDRGVALKPGLLGLLSLLEERRIPVAVATSTIRETAEFTLDAGGIRARVRNLITGDEVADGKPAPDIFLRAADRLDVPPSACIVLEDSDAGIAAACAAGMTAIMVPDLKTPDERSRQTAYAIASSLHEAMGIMSSMLDGRASN